MVPCATVPVHCSNDLLFTEWHSVTVLVCAQCLLLFIEWHSVTVLVCAQCLLLLFTEWLNVTVLVCAQCFLLLFTEWLSVTVLVCAQCLLLLFTEWHTVSAVLALMPCYWQNGTAYYCFCSPKRLDLLRREAVRRGETPRYDNRCRHLQPEEVKDKLANKTPHVIRLKVQAYTVVFCFVFALQFGGLLKVGWDFARATVFLHAYVQDKADRGRGGKTISGIGQAWSLASPRGQWKTRNNGENWLRNHLWCPNKPRS